MSRVRTIAVVAVVTGVSCVPLGCFEPAPVQDWTYSYGPHGPLEPTSESAGLERVTFGAYDEMFPALSPDGMTLLFVSGWFCPDHSMAAALVLGFDPDGTEPHSTYAGGEAFAMSPAWLPDSAGYVYATNDTGVWQLVRSRSREPGSGYDVISGSDETRPLHPTVSPDGSRIAFSMIQDGVRQVAVADIDGGDLRVLGPGDYPSWSPVGREIVYQRPDDRGQTQLFAIAPEGGEVGQRTFGPAANIHPAHDPTGTYVAYGSTHGSDQRVCKVCCGLHVMRADGAGIVQLVGGDVDADWPAWGSDGWIYFTSNESGIYDVWRIRWREGGTPDPRVPADPEQG